jgi:hypothetical protein
MSPDDHTPTLICLIGPPAVGKMTVGQVLCGRTGFKLFDGHVVADVLSPFFPFDTESFVRLTKAWRRMFIEEARQAGLSIVTTVAWRFDVPQDAETIWTWLQPYTEGGRALCVELQAPLEIRIERNRSHDRRQQKNPYWVTDTYLRENDAAHRYDGGSNFPFDLPHLRLDTEHLSAAATAVRIIEHFDLSLVATRDVSATEAEVSLPRRKRHRPSSTSVEAPTAEVNPKTPELHG